MIHILSKIPATSGPDSQTGLARRLHAVPGRAAYVVPPAGVGNFVCNRWIPRTAATRAPTVRGYGGSAPIWRSADAMWASANACGSRVAPAAPGPVAQLDTGEISPQITRLRSER